MNLKELEQAIKQGTWLMWENMRLVSRGEIEQLLVQAIEYCPSRDDPGPMWRLKPHRNGADTFRAWADELRPATANDLLSQ